MKLLRVCCLSSCGSLTFLTLKGPHIWYRCVSTLVTCLNVYVSVVVTGYMLKMFYPTQDCLVNEAVCRNKTFIISFLHLLSCMTGPLLLLLREIVLIHPHYKLTSWRPANLSSVFWDPHLCFLNHVSEHLSWDLTTVLTALSFFSPACVHTWCGVVKGPQFIHTITI